MVKSPEARFGPTYARVESCLREMSDAAQTPVALLAGGRTTSGTFAVLRVGERRILLHVDGVGVRGVEVSHELGEGLRLARTAQSLADSDDAGELRLPFSEASLRELVRPPTSALP